jgi:hypothetical protein
VDGVFEQVRDLAAVRIATYEQRHENQVIQLVCKRFIDGDGRMPLHERKDKNRDDPANFYRASHLEVFLPPSDIVGTYTNVVDVPCEVQVCSMMAHVWNEIEHDLGYKPATGALSDQERNFLITLGNSVRAGDGTIASLFAETERRQREQGGAFADVYDFVARLRGWFPGTDFGRNAGALFESLQPIRLVSPDSIRKLVNFPEPLTDIGRKAVDAFSAHLQSRGETRFALDATSSDLLLVLLLPTIAKHLATPSTDAGTDGIARVRWIAEHFLETAAAETTRLVEPDVRT